MQPEEAVSATFSFIAAFSGFLQHDQYLICKSEVPKNRQDAVLAGCVKRKKVMEPIKNLSGAN